MSIKEKESKVVNNKDNDSHFGLVTMPFHLFNTNPNNKTNGWLIATRTTNYIIYNIANFLDYIKINNLDIITIVNSLVCLKGIGII